MLFLFFLVWIIFNGKVTAEIVILGFIIAALVFAFFCKFMDYSLEKEKRFYKRIPIFIRYAVVLIIEIVKANLTVLHMVLTTKEIMEPAIVKFRTNLKTEMAKVLLANSITLTPGTITVSLEGDEFLVHCLDKSLAEGIEDSVFVKMLEKMEEEEK